MKWLMGFLGECYEAAPAHLNVQMQGCEPLLVHPLAVEADELCSFVGKKANKQWLWLALDARSRQTHLLQLAVLAFCETRSWRRSVDFQGVFFQVSCR